MTALSRESRRMTGQGAGAAALCSPLPMCEAIQRRQLSMAKWPYNTDAWQRLRRAKLAQDPLCEYCPPRRLTPATTVDHEKPIEAGGDPWAWDNLKSCCASCHSRKTAKQDGAFGRKRKGGYGCDEQGRPLDPAHDWNQKNLSGLTAGTDGRTQTES